MAKSSKKASADIIKLVNSYYPDAGKLISYDEAWEMLATQYELQGDIKEKIGGASVFTIYNNKDSPIGTIQFGPETFDTSVNEWDWTEVFKTVIEYCIKEKIFKKKRKTRSDAGLAKPALKSPQKEKVSKSIGSKSKAHTAQEKRVKSQVTDTPVGKKKKTNKKSKK